MLNNLDTLIIDKEHDEIGYVFQFVDRDDYLPYYVRRLGESPNLSSKGEIVVGTKGDGQDRTINPTPMTFIEDAKINLPFPGERVIFDLIGKSSTNNAETGRISAAELGRRLSVNFLHERPEPILVNVCSYIYLPQKDDDTFDPEWQVLDPFSDKAEPNAKLKFYIESFKDPSFRKTINKYFGDAETIEKRNFNDYARFIEKQVDNIIENDFGVEFKAMDNNIQQYLRSVVKSLFTYRQYKYADSDSRDLFVISCQKALETVFLLDKEQRAYNYTLMETEYSSPTKSESDSYFKKRKAALVDLMRGRIITTPVKDKLMSVTRVEPNRANSLKQYIYVFFLTYFFDNHSPLYNLIQGKVEKCFEIADMRNESGHGQTEDSSRISNLGEDAAENTFTFIKDFFNEYMTKAI